MSALVARLLNLRGQLADVAVSAIGLIITSPLLAPVAILPRTPWWLPLGLWASLTMAVPSASAVVLSDFVIFSEDDLSLGTWAMASDGLIGSNHNVSVSSSAMLVGAMGGGNFQSGPRLSVKHDLLFNGDVLLSSFADVLGNVDSGDDITLYPYATIHGNATAGDTITIHRTRAAVLGTATPHGAPAVFTPLVLPPATVFSAGGPDVVRASHQTLSLAPGIYGDLILGGKDTLNLSSGTYFFDSIDVYSGLNLNLDLTGGMIHVFVVGDVDFGSRLTVTPIGGGAELVYFETHGAWYTGSVSKWFGTVYAPHDDLTFSSHAHLTGAFYSGGKIRIGGESAYDHEPLLPEPMSLSLFGLGLAGLGFGHRRRTSLTR